MRTIRSVLAVATRSPRGENATAHTCARVLLFENVAGTTRPELATSAVTGQRSNQLNYVPSLFSSG